MQATVDSYQIQYDDLQKELEETEALYEIGAASQSEVDNLKSSVNKAKTAGTESGQHSGRYEKIFAGKYHTGRSFFGKRPEAVG